jgi:signal transduction histidine kinase
MDEADLKSRLGAEVFDSAPCLVAVVDESYRIVVANRAFHDVFGEREGERCYAVYKGLDHPCEGCAPGRVFSGEPVVMSEESGLDKDGARVCYQVTSLPVHERDESGRPVELALHLSTDNTSTKALEQTLEQAEKLATVGLTTAGLAHTIKNILAGLDGGMYMVRSALEKSDEARLQAGWGMVEKYVEQVSSLVGNLLRYSRSEKPEPERVTAQTLVEQAIELYGSKADLVSIELQGRVAPDLPVLLVDPHAMSAAVANLVSNAMDACMWDPDTDREHRITVSARLGDAGRVRIEVVDNGMGIADEDRDKILKAFFTTKGMRGTGLGLLLTKKAAEQHDGAIGFESTPGQGATFWIEIPPAELEEHVGDERAEPSTAH